MAFDTGRALEDAAAEQVRGLAALRVSRLGPLGFRLRFVFPVDHRFPVVVSQYFNRAQLNLQPLVDPDVPLSSIRLPDSTVTVVPRAGRMGCGCVSTLACAVAAAAIRTWYSR